MRGLDLTCVFFTLIRSFLAISTVDKYYPGIPKLILFLYIREELRNVGLSVNNWDGREKAYVRASSRRWRYLITAEDWRQTLKLPGKSYLFILFKC